MSKSANFFKNKYLNVKNTTSLSGRFVLKDFTLKDQIRRSAISVVSNIAEGFGRKGNKEFVNFLYIANGSLCELQAKLLIAKELNYVDAKSYSSIFETAEILQKKIGALIKYLKTSTLKGEKYKNQGWRTRKEKLRTKNQKP